MGIVPDEEIMFIRRTELLTESGYRSYGIFTFAHNSFELYKTYLVFELLFPISVLFCQICNKLLACLPCDAREVTYAFFHYILLEEIDEKLNRL